MSVTDLLPLETTPQWHALAAHRDALCRKHLREIMQAPDRFERFSRSCGALLADFSKQRVTDTTLKLLIDLAQARNLAGGIAAMAAGEAINTTERRAALHMALRAEGDGAHFAVGGQDVVPEVLATRARLRDFTTALRAGAILGATGKRITHLINLGIGGSDLGPRMAVNALTELGPSGLDVQFVASPDPLDFALASAKCPPEQTLVVVSSKSFSTAETLANAQSAATWLQRGLPAGASISAHLAAVTNNIPAAHALGISPKRCFPIPEWVGGRFSVWSAIGLPVAAAIGMAQFEDILAGARSMDAHFMTTPFEHNLPVLMGLIGLWNIDFLGIPTLAVLPYRHALRHLPAYLQQLDMESNGKSVTHAGAPLGVATAPVVWGCAGPLGQHAFHQLFFQGTPATTLDFVIPVQAGNAAHRLLLTQALGQSLALARGKTQDEAHAEIAARGAGAVDAARIAPHMACAGNVPSTTLLLPGLSAYTLGQLIALYEHKVFVQGCVWGVNSFDQFGVEYGKTMTRDVALGARTDSSTAGLWRHAEQLMHRDKSTPTKKTAQRNTL